MTQDEWRLLAATRDELTKQYDAWGKARLAYDAATFETMIGPGFTCQLAERLVGRAEFIEMVSRPSPAFELRRFDSQILSLSKGEDVWYVVITEKMEAVGKDSEGEDVHLYNLWVTRDGWTREGDKWKVVSTEEIGKEHWRNSVPHLIGW